MPELSTLDKPVTDQEIETFYGSDVSQFEIAYVLGEESTRFDSGELADIAAIHFEEIAEALADGDLLEVGHIIAQARNQRIADWASKKIFGEPGRVSAERVIV